MLMPPYDWVPPKNEKWWSWDILITFGSANVPKNGGVGGGGEGARSYTHIFNCGQKRKEKKWGVRREPGRDGNEMWANAFLLHLDDPQLWNDASRLQSLPACYSKRVCEHDRQHRGHEQTHLSTPSRGAGEGARLNWHPGGQAKLGLVLRLFLPRQFRLISPSGVLLQ